MTARPWRLAPARFISPGSSNSWILMDSTSTPQPLVSHHPLDRLGDLLALAVADGAPRRSVRVMARRKRVVLDLDDDLLAAEDSEIDHHC
jgi:hypothetical protein